MDISPKAMYSKFKTMTNGLMSKHADDYAVTVVKGFVDKLSKLVDTMDKYLKSKDIDVVAMKDKVADKAKDYKAKAVDKAMSLGVDLKNKGLKGYVKEKASGVVGKLGSMFKSDTEGAVAPPGQEGEEAKKTSPFAIILSPIALLTAQLTKLTKVNEDTLEHAVETEKSNEKKEEKKSLLEKFKSGLGFGKKRSDKRAKEIEDEKNGVKGEGDKKKGIFGSILGGIAGMATSLVKFLPGAIGSVLSTVLMGTLGKILPGIVPGLAKGAGAVAGGLTKTIAGLAWRGAKHVAIRAGTALLFNPVGLTVVGTALAVYGGYKLYKHLTQNNTGSGTAGNLTRLRLLSYGYNETVRSEYNKVFSLEEMMEEYVSNKAGKAVFKKFDRDFKVKVAEIFETKVDEKEKFAILNIWFMERFLPAFKAFMDAFYSTATKVKYIDDIDKLSEDDAFLLSTHLRYPLSIYNVTQIPYFSNPTTPVDKSELDNMLASIRTTTTPKTKDAGKLAIAAAKDERKVAESKKEDPTKPPEVKPPTPQKPPEIGSGNANGAAGAGVIETEGEGKEASGKAKGEEANPKDAKIGDVKKANGNLVDGGKSLEGMVLNKVKKEGVYNLDPNVFKLLAGMAKEYKDLTGKSIQINDGFRSRAEQEYLYRTKPKGQAARPDTSLHEKGLAIDVESTDTAVLEKMGLLRKYGFTRPIGGETWHLEPAGVSLNPTEARDRPETREGRILSSVGRGGGGYGTIPKDPKGGRNIELQRKLFAENVGSTVDLEKLKKDKGFNPAPGPAPVDTGSGSSSEGSEGGGGGDYNPGNIKPKDMFREEPVVRTSVAPPKSLDVTEMLQRSLVNKSPPAATSKVDERSPAAMGKSIATDSDKTSDIETLVRNGAKRVGVDPDTMLTFAKMESSLRVGVKNSKSSATGLLQIVGDTWKDLVARRGPEFGVPPDAKPENPEYNAIMGAVYAKENLSQIGMYKKLGLRSDTALYLAHHYGAAGAKRIMKAYASDPDSRMEDCVSPVSLRSNYAEINGKTVRGYIDYLNNRIDEAAGTKPKNNPLAKIDPAKRYGENPVADVKPKETKSYYTPSAEDIAAKPDTTPTETPSAYTNPLSKIDPAKRYGLGGPNPIGDGVNKGISSVAGSINNAISAPGKQLAGSIGQLTNGVNNGINSVTGSLNNAINTPINSLNKGIGSISSGISNGINSVTGSLNNAINAPINSINQGINSVTGSLNNAINTPINSLNNGINSVTNSLSDMFKPRSTPGINGTYGVSSSGQPNPQSNPALSLDKTESLLGSMNDTLTQIKAVLETIASKGGMGTSTPSTASNPDPKPPEVFEKTSKPSEFGISMSRKSVIA